MRGPGRLREVLHAAAGGTFPAEDGSVEVVSPPAGPADAVVGFTAHHLVAAPVDVAEVMARLDPDDVGAPLRAEFLSWLAARLGARPTSLDVVLAAVGRSASRHPGLQRISESDHHPRVRRAMRYRTDVKAYADPDGRGVVVVGAGLDGRAEVAVEVDSRHRGSRLGAALIRAARGLVPDDQPLFAQVAAANASSLRAFLSAGFRPIGAEVLFLRR